MKKPFPLVWPESSQYVKDTKKCWNEMSELRKDIYTELSERVQKCLVPYYGTFIYFSSYFR
jgi:hypothetical protein